MPGYAATVPLNRFAIDGLSELVDPVVRLPAWPIRITRCSNRCLSRAELRRTAQQRHELSLRAG